MNSTWRDKVKHLSKGKSLTYYQDFIYLKNGKVYRTGIDHEGVFTYALSFSSIKSYLLSKDCQT